jgi:hypothetical protein
MRNYLAAKQERKSCHAPGVKITASSSAGILPSITRTCSPEHVCVAGTHALPPASELHVGAEGAAWPGQIRSATLVGPHSSPPYQGFAVIIAMELSEFER